MILTAFKPFFAKLALDQGGSVERKTFGLLKNKFYFHTKNHIVKFKTCSEASVQSQTMKRSSLGRKTNWCRDYKEMPRLGRAEPGFSSRGLCVSASFVQPWEDFTVNVLGSRRHPVHSQPWKRQPLSRVDSSTNHIKHSVWTHSECIINTLFRRPDVCMSQGQAPTHSPAGEEGPFLGATPAATANAGRWIYFVTPLIRAKAIGQPPLKCLPWRALSGIVNANSVSIRKMLPTKHHG